MEWQRLQNFVLSGDWQMSPPTTALVFRLSHRFVSLYSYKVAAQIALCRTTDEGIEIFASAKVNPKTELDIITFPAPPPGWDYCLALKQLQLPNQSIVSWSVSIDMPSYSLDDPTPVNQLAASSKNVTTVTVTTTVSKILAANPLRKGVKFYNTDKLKSAYLDTDNVVSAVSAIESVTPSKPVCVPTINWAGDWYAVSSSGSVTLEVEEYV